MAEISFTELTGKRLSFGGTLSDSVVVPLANEKRLAVFTSGGDAQVLFACIVYVAFTLHPTSDKLCR